jgi:exosome complex component RRP42
MSEHVMKFLNAGMRYDGRKPSEYREVTVETGVSHAAEGSARVRIGKTEVIAGVKLGAESPYPDTPEQGNLMVNVELMPLSSPEFETGPPGDQAIEISRVIDRGIRESKAIDLTKLCVRPKELVWSVMIDVCTINDDGNLMDASALAAVAALRNAVFPKLNEDDTISYDQKTDKKLPLVQTPIEVTVHKLGDHLLVDPVPDEEKAAEARLTVALNDKNVICAMQKGGETPLSIDEISRMVDIAIEKAKELRKKL